MEEEKLNAKLNTAIRGIREINREIKMTAKEKANILQNILNSSSGQLPIKSPYAIYSLVSSLQKNRLVYYGSMCCLLILFGGGFVFASKGSLPGDVLYPLKVKVIEPIHSALLFSPASKVKYENDLASERLAETKTLSDRASKNNFYQGNEEKVLEKRPEHPKRKSDVRSILDTTKESLDPINHLISPTKEIIIDNTNKTPKETEKPPKEEKKDSNKEAGGLLKGEIKLKSTTSLYL